MGEPIPGQIPDDQIDFEITDDDVKPDITIGEEDLRPDIIIDPAEISEHLSELRESQEELGLPLDVSRKIWVDLGVPVVNKSANEAQIMPTRMPHVFMAHRLVAIDDDHPSGVTLENVPVIMAHASRIGDVWKYANGQSVAETVAAFDGVAREQGLALIEFIIACNKDRDNPEIKMADLNLNRPVAQAAGDVITAYSQDLKMIDGRTTITITTDKFWNLDELIAYKSVKLEK